MPPDSRMLSQELSPEALPEVVKLEKSVNNGNCQVSGWDFDFAAKSDTFYKLLVPKLLIELATELRQVGTSNGFELYRRVIRKIDPPKENDAFHMGKEIQGLGGKGTLKDFGQTCRILEFLEQKRKHFLLEIGTAVPLDDSARVLVSVVDKDTLGRLEDSKVSLEDYEKLVDRIRSREVNLRSRSARGASAKDPNAMVYDVGEGPARFEINTPVTSSASSEAGSSQRSASPWTPPAGAQDPWQGAPDPWDTPPGLADPYAQDLTPSEKARASRRGFLSATTASGRATHRECALLRREPAKTVDPNAPIATARTTLQPCAPAREEASTPRRLRPHPPTHLER